MALDIQYDADGCEGTLTREEETDAPSIQTLATWLAGATAGVVLLFLLGGTQFLLATGLAAGLLGAMVYAALGDQNAFAWQPALETVQERFRVRQGVLTLEGRDGVESAPLSGARVTAFTNGVWVNPALGKPILLSWDGASTEDVRRLTEALTHAAEGSMHQRGSRRDVPEHLTKLRE